MQAYIMGVCNTCGHDVVRIAYMDMTDRYDDVCIDCYNRMSACERMDE